MPWSAIWSMGHEKVGIGTRTVAGCVGAGAVAAGFGHAEERGLDRLVSAVEDKDLGWRRRSVLELEAELNLPHPGPRLDHRRVAQRVEVVGQGS